MTIQTQLRTAKRFVGNPQNLDKLCVALVFLILLYELPATVIADVGASFGLYDYTQFYSYRVQFAALVLAVAGLNFIVNHRYVFKDRYFLLYMIFVLYMITIIWINRDLYGAKSPKQAEAIFATEFWLPILFKYLLFFTIGFYLPRLEKYQRPFGLVLIISLGLILFYVDIETMTLDFKNYVDITFIGNYLFIGDATSLAALISIAFLKTNKVKIISTLICGLVIFFIGSRTSFAVFLATVFLYFIISFKPKFLIASAFAVLAIGFALKNIDYSELEARNPRMFGVLVDYESDRSVVGRERLEESGWYDISNNLIMGNFGGQLDAGTEKLGSSWRAYIHGVMSYWRQFGIFAMLVIVAFTFRFYKTLLVHLDKRNQTEFALYFLTGIFLCVEAAFSRSFAFTYTHLFFGLTVSLKYTLDSGQKPGDLSENYHQTKKRILPHARTSEPKSSTRKRRKKSMRF